MSPFILEAGMDELIDIRWDDPVTYVAGNDGPHLCTGLSVHQNNTQVVDLRPDNVDDVTATPCRITFPKDNAFEVALAICPDLVELMQAVPNKELMLHLGKSESLTSYIEQRLRGESNATTNTGTN